MSGVASKTIKRLELFLRQSDKRFTLCKRDETSTRVASSEKCIIQSFARLVLENYSQKRILQGSLGTLTYCELSSFTPDFTASWIVFNFLKINEGNAWDSLDVETTPLDCTEMSDEGPKIFTPVPSLKIILLSAVLQAHCFANCLHRIVRRDHVN